MPQIEHVILCCELLIAIANFLDIENNQSKLLLPKLPSSVKSLPPSDRQDKPCLSDAIREHILRTKVSFHTPGHKGHSWQADGSFVLDPGLKEDISESIPGMDELAYPSGVLQDLETRAAQVWGAQSTLLSLNGATAGIIASIIMAAKHGTHLFVPRNCHRSVLQGLILSGLTPIWFDTIWEKDWGIWGPPDVAELSAFVTKTFQAEKISQAKIAGLFITSPTYSGALADIRSLSELTAKHKIPFIVDEFHGSPLAWKENNNPAALANDADIVIHSLHKNLSCPTQTGLVHISHKGNKEFGFTADQLRACLNLIQSSSPNYISMSAIDKLVIALTGGKAQEQLSKVQKLAHDLQEYIRNKKDFVLYEPAYGTVIFDLLIKHKKYSGSTLHNFLTDKGIFPEHLLEEGILLFLGIGSQQKDISLLISALDEFCYQMDSLNNDLDKLANNNLSVQKPRPIEQAISPRKAFFLPSRIVSPERAIGQISAESLAPCPPGWPVLMPGQLIGEEILSFKNIKSVRIVESNIKNQQT